MKKHNQIDLNKRLNERNLLSLKDFTSSSSNLPSPFRRRAEDEVNKRKIMKKKLLIILFVLVVYCSLLISTTYEIKQDGTGDFTTIQQGINAATTFDTILVYPGTYYENIDYLGKRITVASLELMTGDENYITSTVINGNQNGSCVRFHSGEYNAVLQGFSITNGSGDYHYYSICGGGIQVCENSTVHIINCKIYENNTEAGSGIYIRYSNVYLQGTIIKNNYSRTVGGGILVENGSHIFFDEDNRCSVYSNYAGSGIDIYAIEYIIDLDSIHVVLDTFSVLEPQYYFANYIADENLYTFDILNGFIEPVNQDLYVSTEGNDNNSGLSPEEPMRTITHALFKIFPDSLNPKTVHIASGSYSRTQNNQIFPISAKKYVNIIGEDMETTILNDEYISSYLAISPTNGNNIIKNLTFQNNQLNRGLHTYISDNIFFENITIQNCVGESRIAFTSENSNNLSFKNVIIKNNIANGDKAGMYILSGQDYYFNNCRFENNISLGAGGEWNFNNALRVSSNRDIILNNCVFIGNQDYTYNGKGIFSLGGNSNPISGINIKVNNCLIYNNIGQNNYTLSQAGFPDGNAEITNCTFVNNEGNYSTFSAVGNVTLTNNIFHNDTPYEISVPDLTYEDVITILNVSHCNIQNGEDGINNENGVNIINWLDGNMEQDPQFLDEGENPYQLSEFSPCIDAGTPDTTGLFLPPWDLLHNQRVWDGNDDGTAIIDMGCYEYGAPTVSVEEPEILDLTEIKMFNFPNPFRSSTTISFNNIQSGDVKLEIFNIKGQKVKTLIDSYMSPGKNKVFWNGKDRDGKKVSNGVYFYKLNVDDEMKAVRKMILLY